VVNQAFGQTIAQMLGNLFSLVGIIIAMLLINLRLGLVSNLIVPLMIFTTGFFARWHGDDSASLVKPLVSFLPSWRRTGSVRDSSISGSTQY